MEAHRPQGRRVYNRRLGYGVAYPKNRDMDMLRDLWWSACAVEGLDPSSSFVVFSDDNQAAQAYNAYMGVLMHLGVHLDPSIA